MFLALDPGETTGFAIFEQNGKLNDLGQIEGMTAFVEWLSALDPKPALIIYERYRVDPNVPHGGLELGTVQIIGQIRKYAIENGIVAYPQERTVKLIGYRWSEMKPLPKSRHAESHQYDAMAHGVYYMVKHKITPLTFNEE